MENTVKIVGIKKMLKKDTKDQYYFNLYYTQPFSQYDVDNAVDLSGVCVGAEFAREDYGVHVGDEVEFLYTKGFQDKAFLAGVKVVKAAPASKVKSHDDDFPPFK